MIDADTVLEPDALSRAVLPFLEDAATVAVGGNVAIANGSRVEHGRITKVALPRSWVGAVPDRRATCGASSCSALPRHRTNGVVIISGAFGLFRRDAVIAVGGYDRTAIGEDMDLTLRLQRHYRERREPFRIAFDPRPALLDAGARRLVVAAKPALAVAPRTAPVALASSPHDRQSAHGRCRSGCAAVRRPFSRGSDRCSRSAATSSPPWPRSPGFQLAPLPGAHCRVTVVRRRGDAPGGDPARSRDEALPGRPRSGCPRCRRAARKLWLSAAQFVVGCVGTVQALAGRRGWGVVKRRVFEGEKDTGLEKRSNLTHRLRAAVMVLSTSFTVCAVERNHASNCDGGG